MRGSSGRPWSLAKFPSRSTRERFLDHVRHWNRVESLPRIETEVVPDGTCLRFCSADAGWTKTWRLVDAFGGWVPPAERY
jgi:hypothetical protein